MKFQEVFKRLNGRDAEPADILKFERLTATLETTPGDALLAVLVALNHYETLYATIPAKISESATNTLAKFKDTADAQAITALANAKADLAKAVSEAAQQVAQNVTGKQKAQWIVVCLLVSCLTFVGGGMYMHSTGHSSGYSSGYGAGYTEAKDEKAAAAWANTPEGKLAYRLAQAGNIGNLARCDRPGWYVEKGVCYVKPASNFTYGWQLP